MIKFYASGTGIPAAYGQYAPRLVESPAGSDLTEEWEFFVGLAKRMKLDMWFVNFFGGGGGRFMESPPVVLNINGDTEMTTEELFEKMCTKARIPLAEVAAHPHGRIVDVDAVVGEKDADCVARLDVGNVYLLSELEGISAHDFRAARSEPNFPLRLIPRRHGSFMNSSGTALAALNRGKAYNPVYMHHDAMAALGIEGGSLVTVTSPHDSIPSVLEADDTLRRDASRLRGIGDRGSRGARPRKQRRPTGTHRDRLRPDHRHAASRQHPGARHREAELVGRPFTSDSSPGRRRPSGHRIPTAWRTIRWPPRPRPLRSRP